MSRPGRTVACDVFQEVLSLVVDESSEDLLRVAEDDGPCKDLR
jgi:hypothetical protein